MSSSNEARHSPRFGGKIRLWPMPDVSRPPLHTLPYDQLLAKLRTFTNLRVVVDPESTTGFTIEPAPFRGWANLPQGW